MHYWQNQRLQSLFITMVIVVLYSAVVLGPLTSVNAEGNEEASPSPSPEVSESPSVSVTPDNYEEPDTEIEETDYDNVETSDSHENEYHQEEDQCPTPTPSPRGSITICKIIVDKDGNIIDGSEFPGVSFEISAISPDSSLGDPIGLFGDATFTTPLVLDSDQLPEFDGNDSQCITFSGLLIGPYYYGSEWISGGGNWLEPLYNDQFTIPVIALNDFFSYDDNLFDGDSSNDWERNQNVDGHIVLTEARSNRTLIVLNRNDDENGVGGCPDCETPSPSPEPSQSPSPTPDNGNGGVGGGGPGFTPTPSPSPSESPSQGGNGGGGGGLPISPTPTPSINGGAVSPSPTPAVGGAMDELPPTNTESGNMIALIAFGLMVFSGVIMILRGQGFIVYEKK